jgi:NAD(P)-dependent dehydrogenase (short-subunit alcohol dehydrogenase family)
MKGLDGKVAIISGGATLIGESCAAVLAGYGVDVVIADINEADGKAVAQRIGKKASVIRADITSDEDIAALVKATVDKHKRLDFLVNVACTYLDNLRRHGARRLAEGARRQHCRLGDADAGGAPAS